MNAIITRKLLNEDIDICPEGVEKRRKQFKQLIYG